MRHAIQCQCKQCADKLSAVPTTAPDEYLHSKLREIQDHLLFDRQLSATETHDIMTGIEKSLKPVLNKEVKK